MIDHGQQTYKVIINGKTGSGKSTLAKKLIRNKSRVIIIDPMGEYSGGIVFYTLKDFAKYINNIPYINHPAFEFFYILRFDSDPEIEQAFNLLYYITNYWLVIDEVDNYAYAQFIPDGLKRIVRYGRRKGIHVIAISRRPAEIHRDLTAQANQLYIFHTNEPRDLQYFKKYTGDPEIEKKIMNLKKHEYLFIDRT